MVIHGGQRLSYDIEDPFRPLRPALVEQGQAGVLTTRRLRVPLSRQSAAVVLLRRGALLPLWGATPPASLTQALPPPPQARHLTTPALRVEAPGGRRIEPKTIPVPPWDGRNGRGWSSPRCVKPQAAVFFALTPRRPDPFFFFGVKDRFFFRRKRNGLSPPEGIRPPQVGTLPVRAAAGRPYPGGWRAGSSRPTPPAGALPRGGSPLLHAAVQRPPEGLPGSGSNFRKKFEKSGNFSKKAPSKEVSGRNRTGGALSYRCVTNGPDPLTRTKNCGIMSPEVRGVIRL